MIQVVRGNTLHCSCPLQINVGGTLQPYTPQDGDKVYTNLIGALRYGYKCTVTGNVVNFTVNADLPSGTYGLEVIVNTTDGEWLRSFRTNLLNVVESTDELIGMPDDGEFDVDSIELDAALFIGASSYTPLVVNITYEDNTYFVDATNEEIFAAFTAGREVMATDGENVLYLSGVDENLACFDVRSYEDSDTFLRLMVTTNSQGEQNVTLTDYAMQAATVVNVSESGGIYTADLSASYVIGLLMQKKTVLYKLGDDIFQVINYNETALAYVVNVARYDHAGGNIQRIAHSENKPPLSGQFVVLYNFPIYSKSETDTLLTGKANVSDLANKADLNGSNNEEFVTDELRLYDSVSQNTALMTYDEANEAVYLDEGAHTTTIPLGGSNKILATTADLATKADKVVVESVASATTISQTCQPNKFYKIGAVEDLTLDFNFDGTIAYAYGGKFEASANGITVTLASGYSLADGSATPSAGNVYEFTMVDYKVKISKV